MKAPFTRSVLLTSTLTIGLFSGFFIHKYGVITVTHNYLKHGSAGVWSIGIYEGATPFSLAASTAVDNPVLTEKDIFDRDAIFVADPFMTIKDDKYYMFFEVMNRKPKLGNQGDIGYAESSDGYHWDYKKIILDEPFHLAYPQVFEWNGDYYLIPDSYQNLSVRLYKAVSFPEEWEYVGNLLAGHHYVDPAIFRHDDKWWLFVSNVGSSILNLHYSSDLLGDWKPHPMNPLVKFDANIARPGGRVVTDDDKVYRITQDDFPDYGNQVFAFEITELSETSYVERIVQTQPIVTKTGKGWNAAGMHHIDAHKVDDRWISVVDGKHR